MKYNFSESLFKKKFARSALLGDRCERHLGYQNDPEIKVVGDYIVGARFAQGKACKVKEGISLLTGERVVIKIIKIISINKKSDKVSMAIKEIKNYSAVNNINVVKLRSAYVKIEHCDYVSSLNMEGDLNFAPAEICPIVGDLSILKCIQQKISKIYMVFEFCICNLEEYIAHSPNQIIEEKLCKSYFIQILNGLNGIHSMNIIHADIKPSNIFLTKDGIIKIGDLGLSRRCPPGTSNRLPVYPAAGTKLYLAPEVISGAQNIDGEKVDIWACGVTLHYMLSGEYPFNIERGAQNYFVLLDLILKTPPKLAKCLNPCAKDLIGMKNPERRPNIVEILSHEWCRSSPKVHIPLDLSIFSSNRSDPEEMQKCEICYPGEYNIMARIYGHNVVRYVKKYHDIFLDADNKNSEK